MDAKEMKSLIDAFISYKETLTPVQNNLHDFAETYEKLKDDIEKLNKSFGNEAAHKMEQIYQNLAKQAESANTLSEKIDKFSGVSEKYFVSMQKLISAMDGISEKIALVDGLEKKAESQIALLDNILEEKKNYDITMLQKSLSSYNSNVQKVSEFINKDVAEALKDNNKKLENIAAANTRLSEKIENENKDLLDLINKFTVSGELIKEITEKSGVNEVYLFEILDKWAEARKVKTKK